MPRPAGMTRVTFVGTLPNAEIFNTSFWVTGVELNSETEGNAYANEVVTRWEATTGGNWRLLINADARYDEVRVYHYPATTGPAEYIGSFPITAGQGTSSGPHLPLQSCLVATLETGLSGRRRRGRMYLPMTGMALQFHQTTLAQAQTVANSTAQFFSSINDDVYGSQVVVLSQVGAGSTAPVTTVSVDTEPDIQRRRANRQTEIGTAQASVVL